MPRTIMLATAKSQRPAEGAVALLYVGNYQHKFFIHQDPADGPVLSDYASGYRVGTLNPIKIRNYRSYHSMTDREAARELLADIIARSNADAVLKTLKSAPAINT